MFSLKASLKLHRVEAVIQLCVAKRRLPVSGLALTVLHGVCLLSSFPPPARGCSFLPQTFEVRVVAKIKSIVLV